MRSIITLALTIFVSMPATSLADECEGKSSECSCEAKTKKKDWKRKFPPIKTGFLIDLEPGSRDGFFYFGLEIINREVLSKKVSVDFGVASGRIITGLGLGMFFDDTVGPFIWGGYNISANAFAWGVGINMLKL